MNLGGNIWPNNLDPPLALMFKLYFYFLNEVWMYCDGHFDENFFVTDCDDFNSHSIGLYRENAIAIQNESGDSNGGNV